jgi:hypothetical protein
MARSFDEILGKDSIANLQKPIETAKGLPAAAYTSQEFFDLEQERLFPRTWMGVAFAEDVANPGDAIPVTVTGLRLSLCAIRTESSGRFITSAGIVRQSSCRSPKRSYPT